MPAKILIADASPHAQRMGVRFLTELGYDVEGVSNGPAALKSIEDQPPALIIAALSMPGISGFELCQQVKRRPAWAQIPILLALGPFEVYDAEEGKKVGAQGLIEKPFESSKLEKVVGDFVPRPASGPATSPAASAAEAEATPVVPTATDVTPAPSAAGPSQDEPVSSNVSAPVTEPDPTPAPVAPLDRHEADDERAEVPDTRTAAPAVASWHMEEIPLSEAERQAIWEGATVTSDSATPPAWEFAAPEPAAAMAPEPPPEAAPWTYEAAVPDPVQDLGPEPESPVASSSEPADTLVLDALRAIEPTASTPAAVLPAAGDAEAVMAVVRKVLGSYLSPLMVEEVVQEIVRQLPPSTERA
ncbi:MAG: response regulator [Terriglobales bacterium]